MASTSRPYNGVETDERVAQRRERLLQVGLDILGNPLGDDDLTLRTICARGQLAQRYFYESFADKDEFAAAVYDWALTQVVGSVQQALAEAAFADGARVGLTQLIESVAADRRIGELLFSPHQVNTVIVAKRFESTGLFVELFSKQVRHEFRLDGAGRAPLISHFLVGGVAQSIGAWLNGEVQASQQDLVDDLVAMLTAQGVGRTD